MKAEYESYAPDTQQILEAFTAGINAYIESRLASGEPTGPLEFQLEGFLSRNRGSPPTASTAWLHFP